MELWSQSWHWAASLASEPSAFPPAKLLLPSGLGSGSKSGVDEGIYSWRHQHQHPQCSWESLLAAGVQLDFLAGRSWVPACGAWTGPCWGLGGWGCTPGSCGFVVLPPMRRLRRFGELCAWWSQRHRVPNAAAARAKPSLVRKSGNPTTSRASFMEEFTLYWFWVDADSISGRICL